MIVTCDFLLGESQLNCWGGFHGVRSSSLVGDKLLSTDKGVQGEEVVHVGCIEGAHELNLAAGKREFCTGLRGVDVVGRCQNRYKYDKALN